ncbi:hypothetical protein F1880_006330 [Penicillium rolfsii]|nr:hypothetical protein F1880_006330 [Penicillium rolfsii]
MDGISLKSDRISQLTLLHALEHLLGLLVLNQWVGEGHDSTDRAVDSHGIDLNIGDNSSSSLFQTLRELGGDLLLYRISESGLILLFLLVLLRLVNTVLLGTLLLLLSALLLLLDLVLAHFVGLELKTGARKNWVG